MEWARLQALLDDTSSYEDGIVSEVSGSDFMTRDSKDESAFSSRR